MQIVQCNRCGKLSDAEKTCGERASKFVAFGHFTTEISIRNLSYLCSDCINILLDAAVEGMKDA